MDIVDLVRKTNSQNIAIPFYHRALISLMPGSAYTGVLLLGRREEDISIHDPEINLIPQIVISPYPFEDWNYLWRISCSIRERKGVVYDIVKTLQRASLNVLSEVSRAVHLNQFHYIELVVSARELVHRGTLRYYQTLERMRETILVEHLEDLLIEDYGGSSNPPLRIEKLTRYANLREQCESEWTNPERSADTKKPIILTGRGIKNGGVVIDMPPSWLQELRSKNGYRTDDAMSYFIHTNSAHQLLSMYFPHSTQELCNVRIVHKDEIGAIAAFTAEMLKAGINLVSTLTRKQENEINHFEFVCERQFTDEGQLVEMLKTVLNTSEVAKYEPILMVPKKAESDWPDWETIWQWDEVGSADRPRTSLNVYRPRELHSDDESRRETLRNKLDGLYTLYTDKSFTDAESRDLLHRIRIAENLLGFGLLAKPRVFLSHKMNELNRPVIDRIGDLFEENGFDVTIGIGTRGGDDIEKRIMEEIDKCSYFVAVLTADENNYYPTYWVIWEYGYARSRALLCRLMREENVILPTVVMVQTAAPSFSLPGMDSEENQIALKRIEEIVKGFADEFRFNWEQRKWEI